MRLRGWIERGFKIVKILYIKCTKTKTLSLPPGATSFDS